MSILGIRVANLLLFSLSCYLVADIINRVGAFALIPEGQSLAAVAPPAAPTALPWSKRQMILDRNLFGAQVVEEQALEEPEPEEDLQKTRLPLRLLGTVASEDNVVASAAIENTQDRLHQVVRTGHTLNKFSDVVVARIERGRVVLQNGAQREELLLDPNGPSLPSPIVSKRASPRASRRRASPPARPNVQDRLAEMVSSGAGQGAAALLGQARILPKYQSGKMKGIELSQIKADSLFEKIGLIDGDVITSINGLLIDDPTAQQKLLGAFTGSEELVAEVTAADGTTRQIQADASLISSMMSGGQ
ncbi:MAG: type II secretion system protein N [Myxococcota bacterium]|jgi:general secretion pathway protein C|nr:type II secretion system protein N [Myxococcota bacterium]